MQNAFQLRNRIFAVATITAMILGSLSAVLVPASASAASAGDLIKGESLSTVYYYAPDGMRYTFPNEKTFMTWYQDFDSVETISDSALADITLGGNIVNRPGTSWIKIQSDPKVYAVATDGTIHWIESEDVAVDYAGDDWASYVQDVPDVFFVDYTSGTSLTAATAYDGMMYLDGTDTYISWDGEKLLVSDLEANNMTSAFYLDGAGIDDSSLTAGSEVDGADAAIVDASQQGGVDETTAVVSGDVEISLSSSNPSGVSVPTNANTVEVFSFDVTAGDDATEVGGIAVKMVGLSASTDVSDVYLYEGSTRLTEARSINSSTRKATFSNLNLDLDAGETRTITVRVTVAATAGDELQFAIYEVGDIDAEGDISGDFPIEGDTFAVSAAVVGTVVVTETGSVSNPSLGANDAEIAGFKFTIGSAEAGNVQSMTLKVDDAGDHDDFKLWADGEIVATGEYIGSKLVKFDFDTEYNIAKGGSESFTLTADIGGEDGEVIRVTMDNAIDVVVEGAIYSFPMDTTITAYDGNTCTSDGSECSYSTIQGGEVTFDVSGPTAGDIRVNSQDQVLLEFTVISLQDITVKDLPIIVTAEDDGNADPFTPGDDSTDDDDGLINTDAEANITDIRIINVATGSTLMGPLELDCVTLVCGADGTQDGTQTIDFTDDFDMEAGETLTLQVVVDVDNTITAATELGATIDITATGVGFVAEDYNGDTLTNADDVIPTSDLTGYAQTVRAASLTVSLSATPGDVTTIHGMDDVLVNSFNFVGGDAGLVDISSIVVGVYSDTAVDTGAFTKGDHATAPDVNSYIESCSIYNIAGDLLDGPESPASTGLTITFGDVDWTIIAGQSERLDLYCNMSNPSASTTYYFAFDLVTLADDVTAEDEDGTDVDPTGTTNASTNPTNIVTLASAGSIAVTAGSGSPSADFLLTDTLENHVASYRITATNEDMNVSVFTVSEEQAEDDAVDDTTDGNNSTYANNISLVTIEYPLEDGTTASATASMNGNEAKFSLATAPIFVDSDQYAAVEVYVDVPVTDRASGGSATSNEKVRMGFFVDATNDDNFKAVGVGSGTTLDDDDVSAIGDDKYSTDGIATFVVQETKPTISLSSSSPSGTSIPGDVEVFRFNVSASANEDVIIRELLWKFSATDNASSDWNFCDTNASGTGELDEPDMDLYNLSVDGTSTALDDDAEWTFLDSADTTVDTCTDSTDEVDLIQLEFNTDAETITVPAGDTHTFALYMDLTGASATNDDSVQLSLAGPTDTVWMSGDSAISDAVTLTISSTDMTVATGSTYGAGDQICFTGTADTVCGADEEIALITEVTDGGVGVDTLYLVRGYLGTNHILPVTGDLLSYRADPLFWEDDGTAGTLTTVATAWGSYLVDNLPVTGNAIQF